MIQFLQYLVTYFNLEYLFEFPAIQELTETSPGSLTWVAHKDPPSFDRWTAFFVDVQYDGKPYESLSAEVPNAGQSTVSQNF